MLTTFQTENLEELTRVEALIQEVRDSKFDYSKIVEFPTPILNFYSGGRKYPVGGRGMIGGITGEDKSGKSFVVGEITDSFLLDGAPRLNFELLTDGNMVFFDTEQSAYFFDATQRRIHNNARIRGNSSRYDAYHLRKWKPMERILAMQEIMYTTPNLHVVVIDGIVDMLADYNNLEQAMGVMELLMRWSYDLNVLLFGILHVNKGDGKLRGHLGSEYKNKCDFIIKAAQAKRNEFSISNPTGRFLTFPEMQYSRNEDTGEAIYDNEKDKFIFKI